VLNTCVIYRLNFNSCYRSHSTTLLYNSFSCYTMYKNEPYFPNKAQSHRIQTTFKQKHRSRTVCQGLIRNWTRSNNPATQKDKSHSNPFCTFLTRNEREMLSATLPTEWCFGLQYWMCTFVAESHTQNMTDASLCKFAFVLKNHTVWRAIRCTHLRLRQKLKKFRPPWPG